MEIFELNGIITRADELANASGNSGRAIRRFIDSYFKDGKAQLLLEGNPQQSLVLAYQMSRLRDACQLATAAVSELEDASNQAFELTFTEGRASEFDGLMELNVSADIPEGMKARQDFLAAFAYGLRRIHATMMLVALDMADNLDVLDKLFQGCEVTVSDMATYLNQFEALLDGDYSQFAVTPIALIGLACHIRTEVADYDTSYDLDSEGDEVPPAVPVGKPFAPSVPVYPVM